MLASSSSASPSVRRRSRAASCRLAPPGARVASVVGRTFLVLSLLLAPAVVHAHSSRPGGCDASAGHGTSSSTGDGGYTLTHTSGTLAPGERVTVTLAKPSSGADFKGFVVYASGGSLEPGANAGVANSCRSGNAVGHTSSAGKSSAEAHVTLPDTAGAVTVTAQIVVSKSPNVMYQTELQLDVPASGGDGGNATPSGSGTADSSGSGTTDSSGSGTTDSSGSGTADSGGSGNSASSGYGNSASSGYGNSASSAAASVRVTNSFAYRVAVASFLAALATSARW